MRRTLGAVLTLGLLLIAPASSAALKWMPVTGPTQTNSQEVGTVRGPDGTLHVVWTRNTPGSSGATNDLVELPISAGGVVGSPVVIAPAYSTISNPAIVNTPGGGLEVLFGAIQCSDPACAGGLFSTTSTDGGRTWSPPTALFDRDANYSSPVGAVTLSDGTPLETWYGTSGVFVHRGTDTSTPDYDYQGAMGATCCGYYSNLAVDPAGNVEAAWSSNATGFLGVWAQAVNPASGAPAASPMLMPGSVTSYGGSPNISQMLQRTPIIALSGQANHFYVAYPGGYPSTNKVLLWQVGSPSSTTFANESGDHNEVSVAADSHDRIWVFWNHLVNDVPHVFARRLGTAGLEPAVDLGSPAHAESIYAVDGAVSPGGDPEALALTGFANGTNGTYYVRGPQVAPPVNGVGFDLIELSGNVRFQPGGHGPFFPLLDRQPVPVASVINATHGSVQIQAATVGGALESTKVSGGPFVVSQRRHRSLVSLKLTSFNACAHHTTRSMSVSGGGQVDTRGRYATATGAHGARWVMQDECAGTLVKVMRGPVTISDLVRHVTIVIRHAGGYLARR